MKTEDQLANLYCAFLDQIRARLRLVREVARGESGVGSEADNHEVIAVNLRKVLELIAFGSLTANKSAYAAAHADFAKHWKVKRLFSSLEKIHPDFYPKPLLPATVVRHGPPRHLHYGLAPDGYLTRDEFIELYDLCSQVIHTRNPFADATTIDFRIPISGWVSKIETLLGLHLLRLAGTPQIWIAELCAPTDKRAHAYIAAPSS